jgi:hypothetical protein
MIEASTTFPFRNRYMYQPTSSAIGIVQAIVNVPQELPGTSRLAPAGMTRPSPSGLDFKDSRAGIARSNDSWKVIASRFPSPNR